MNLDLSVFLNGRQWPLCYICSFLLLVLFFQLPGPLCISGNYIVFIGDVFFLHIDLRTVCVLLKPNVYFSSSL